MNEPPKQRWGCLQWGIVISVIFLLISLCVPMTNTVAKVGVQTKGVNNCKQIILALKQYSKDAGSAYPDSHVPGLHTSNEAFRELFKSEIVEDESNFESIFGCPKSLFIADRNIGLPPDFKQALSPGECHWMLVKNQSDDATGNMPLVFENTLDTSWPPRWDVSEPEQIRKRGQAWRGRAIIIGRNDGSVRVEKLREDGSLDWRSTDALDPFGKKIKSWPAKQVERFSWLDIEEK